MNHQAEICPDCETGHLHVQTYSDAFDYKGNALTVDGLQCWVCDHCESEIIRADQIRHGDKLFADARRRFDGLLTGDDIVQLRKKLGLTQHQAADLFGGGANAFSKYERGDVTQSVAMDRLMRIVARFPALLACLAGDAGVDAIAPTTQLIYSHVANSSINDPEFRSRPARNRATPLEIQEWSKVS
ncbi:MAG: type II toxin-antitoxin system MqsA family antitoxin [Gammaproteobacteria bacterium]|jgi:HTH-type transcriptional regulator/antitoxin MqsA|nr:type II toxin-antitoxin system MqsA family antitoxin [Gammaproteobacteria bacterium]